jgi:hypothetical protein
MCVRERKSDGERKVVCMCVCVRERKGDGERKVVCMCVCVRERERERESECVFVNFYPSYRLYLSKGLSFAK